MKVQLQTEKVYTIVCGDVQIPAMRQVASWEGFIKLQGPDGVAILADDSGPTIRTLDEALGVLHGWTIVKASPAIVAKLAPTEQPQ